MTKTRLDQLVVEQSLAESRSRAQQMIDASEIADEDGNLLIKPSQKLDKSIRLKRLSTQHQWVSRGAQKLLEAMRVFPINVKGQVIADIGASTGGFTEVLLHARAAKIYAVDVGQGQLHPTVANDPRVVNCEQTNARYLDESSFEEELLDAVVCDASFISLKLVLPAALSLVRSGGWLVALIKPQFEVGKGNLGKGGVVKDPQLHQQTCDEISIALQTLGWHVEAVIPSPITGPKGNKEFLLYAIKK
jgi:23S rRNA (cytidine1920-2'-O)/16S rRNA (cytidine1409-2'-O)-methyltransferase